ncbi:NADH-cytochrome b5 reductase-like [Holothuria leucospilota]|uniref:NADH-cytochrome b5 reductase-like n=1 Tax=Holothuria leucospilota TaxID=206669 RepID=A0A9Q1C8I3_HOLLE|nr:NADH-cytochrome b5 reductase-like [Holothuria leucospilota]
MEIMQATLMDDYEVCVDCLSSRPVEPVPSDCCGQGCSPCVLDIYDEELKLWKKNCWKRHGGGSDEVQGEPVDMMKPDEYTICKLITKDQVTTNTFLFTFALPEGYSLDLALGQHLVLRQEAPTGGIITRQYTPISPTGRRNKFTVLIKLYEDGKMSRCIRDWQVGTHCDWRGPIGSFSYHVNQYSHIYLIAAGTGITPLYGIISHIVENDNEETFVRLLYASRSYNDILLRKKLNELALYWNFSVRYFLSQNSGERQTNSYGEEIHVGRISKTDLAKEIAVTESSQAIVCGTRHFEADMKGYLLELGIQEDRIVRF